MKISKAYLNKLTYKINGAAIEVHKELGSGLLETVYQQFLAHELNNLEIEFQTEKTIPINFNGCDLIVENSICIELKAVKDVLPYNDAQLLSYMKLLKMPKGILFNFNVYNLYNEGQKTFVNEHFANLI